MNGKYCLAIFLAVQVSMTLCSIPDPDPELVAKYEDLKKTFISRVIAAYNRAQGVAAPYVEKAQEVATPYIATASENAQVQTAKEYFEELKNYPQTQTLIKFFTDLTEDAGPVVDKARNAGLGLYGEYLRPHVGTSLDTAIAKIKEYLDLYLPAAK